MEAADEYAELFPGIRRTVVPMADEIFVHDPVERRRVTAVPGLDVGSKLSLVVSFGPDRRHCAQKRQRPGADEPKRPERECTHRRAPEGRAEAGPSLPRGAIASNPGGTSSYPRAISEKEVVAENPLLGNRAALEAQHAHHGKLDDAVDGLVHAVEAAPKGASLVRGHQIVHGDLQVVVEAPSLGNQIRQSGSRID